MLRGTLLKFLNGRLLVKFVDERFIRSTMDGNIHFSSYEYFKKLEEGVNDKGKRDKNENAEYDPIDLNRYAFFIRFPKKGEPPLSAKNQKEHFKDAKYFPLLKATEIINFLDEDKKYGISSFVVIDPDKDMENGKIKASFIKDVSEISNNRKILLFSEYDLIKSLIKFEQDNNSYDIACQNVEYTKSNKGIRNGFQKDPKYSRQHEWRIRINMNILNDNGYIYLPRLDIGIVNKLEGITIIDK
ncbi:hypothetical protein FC97_GL001870 [Companilactobacillus kimchii DSM 13961 = JCM 10707]|uniref:Uncharacterized protein n=1 Tax=Companilactobacillus kimchii DSM 13961 = JCM 10707 TaxID=1423765 RepID=A0ABR5NR09_9LACO|nr:hypothetical protein FC97_GL001870 [Companilactobacillus kimchii DSM 13961 = JCM 10707]